jgi:4-hydroxymandelate oxidase
VDLEALEREVRAKLDPALYAYFAGGSEDERTLAANLQAWDAARLRPHVLRDCTNISTRATVLGAELAAPIGIAPMGNQSRLHPDGVLESARGAAAAGALTLVPLYGSGSALDVARALPGAVLWLQVYLLQDRERSLDAIARCAEAGYRAVVLTVDVARPGNRPAAVRATTRVPDRERGGTRDPSELFDRALEPRDVAWLAQRIRLPLVIKGVLRGDDAAACVDAGAAGIVVSNHGGRQLDGAIASADALPEVIDAVAGRAEVYVDGGLRRGRHVLTALALGARAAMVGRPIIWGLASSGANGVRDVVETLRSELERAMALCGARSLGELGRDLLAPPRGGWA